MALKITTLALFASANPTLADGDYGIESDTGHYKLGDGATAWNSLPYYNITSDFLRNVINELNLVAASSLGSKATAKNVDYQMVYTDGTILVTTGAADKTITLPSIASSTFTFNGSTFYRIYNIKKVDSGAGKVIVAPQNSLLDGATTKNLSSQYDCLTVQPDGSNWHIL